MPCFCANARTARRFAIEIGCPPAMFTVAARLIYGIFFAPTLPISDSSAVEIDVALERMLVGRIVGFGNDDIDERPAGQFLMQPRGREIHVARHEIARLDEHPREDVLGPAALVRGHDVAVAVILPHGFFQMIEVLAARVGLVAQHHAGPLPIAHGVGAAIGEKIDVNVFRAEQKRVEAGLDNGLFPLPAGSHLQRLDDFDFPRLGPGTSSEPGERGSGFFGHGGGCSVCLNRGSIRMQDR